MISPASLIFIVILVSDSEGLRFPDGWLCATISPGSQKAKNKKVKVEEMKATRTKGWHVRTEAAKRPGS